MSFKSYISVETKQPDGFYDMSETDQEEFWILVYSTQQHAERAYKDVLKSMLGSTTKYCVTVESK